MFPFPIIRLLCCLLLAGAAAAAWAQEGEAPVVAGLLEAGQAAERRHALAAAEARYCAAARLGSVESQYRLGRLYLGKAYASRNREAWTLLAMAASQGHGAAQGLMDNQSVDGEAVPACLTHATDAQALLAQGIGADQGLAVARLAPDRLRIARLVEELARRHGVDPRLALAIARVESNFDPSAVSARNALGVMQLIPATAARFGVRDPLDPTQNVKGGLAYLRWLMATFDGDLVKVVAAYNAGEGNVQRHGGVPPFSETRDYVRKVLGFHGGDGPEV
jgi:soluble lytic murein transglycosylase-like protein